MTKQTNAPSIDGPLVDALSDHMMAVCGRRPTQGEMWDIYWSAVNAIFHAILCSLPKKADSDGP